jgi:SAM-dependent methyltransferase
MVKICPFCAATYPGEAANCPKCGQAPKKIGPFETYAPELAEAGGGYDRNHFAALAPLEETNFWFRARNRLLLWALKIYGSRFSSLLEIGCGTGYVLSGIARAFPHVRLMGSEIFVAGLDIAAERVSQATLLQMDARKIPFIEEFDVVGAFDVLEHIEQDQVVMGQIHAALKPAGIFLATVPQHKWLWSTFDDSSHHVRRYTAGELHRKLRKAGFEIIRSTSFVSLLLPLMVLSRLKQKRQETFREDSFMEELRLAPWLNAVLFGILQLELAFLRLGVNFPLGGSRLVVAKKPTARRTSC